MRLTPGSAWRATESLRSRRRSSASTEEREAGFRETIASKFPGIAIVDEQFGQSVRETSVLVGRDLLAMHPDLDGLFGSNESSAYGVSLHAASMHGKPFLQ